MLLELWSLKWALLFLFITGCGSNDKPPIKIEEVTVTGQIMLGPVDMRHSLQLVIYDIKKKELDNPKIDLNGSYAFKLKDYEGAVIAQVTSNSFNPEQCTDYIDEATANQKCLGKNTLLSSMVVNSSANVNDNKVVMHITPVTTIAAINAGIVIDEEGKFTVSDKFTNEQITKSNIAIAKA